MCHDNFEYIQQIDEYLENFHIFLKNRNPNKIYLVSSNQTRLVAAMLQGFCSIPVINYSKYDEDKDIQLKLVENYLF